LYIHPKTDQTDETITTQILIQIQGQGSSLA